LKIQIVDSPSQVLRNIQLAFEECPLERA
jgi:hypothetical protein